MLGYFTVSRTSPHIQGVPVCADYCDAWFEACKDDMTCVESWWTEFNFEDGSNANSCPDGSTCRTFQDVYRDGEGLCNMIWGDQLIYSTNSENCTVMTFDNSFPNPNFNLAFPQSSSLSVVKSGSTMIYGAVILMLLVTAATIY